MTLWGIEPWSEPPARRWTYVGIGELLPVQCCCEPGLRFGWVPVPKAANGLRVHFGIMEPHAVRWPAELRESSTTILSTDIMWHLRVAYPARLLDCGHWTIPLSIKRLAVSSGDYPLSTWQKVPGFRERR